MQQQMCQQDPMGQHQVMLCPVRLVYETQILLQPGEQIHPNQTMFINPQNPPPWIQNRPQNQVIYMQQMPNNMMPAMPQQMLSDQSQLYIQNYAYPPQMMQVDQMRQMPNVMTQNMMGIGTNVGHTIQNVGQGLQNVGQSIQNVALSGQNMPMGSVVQNVQKVMPSYNQNVGNDRVVYNTVPNTTNNTMGMTHNQPTVNINQTMQERPQMNQNLVNMQKVSELQGLKQQSVRPPQVSVSPMPNAKFGLNVGDSRPMAMAPRPQSNISNMNLGPNNMQVNAMAKNKVPLPNKASPGVLANQIRHHNQTYYRPIQPRPMSVMPMAQNQYLPMQSSNPAPRPQTQINTDLNRKRKSESPDETRKKIPINNTNNSIIHNHIIAALHNTQNVQNLNVNNQMNKIVQSEIGINTNPVQREIKPVKNVSTMSTGTQANIVREKPQMDNLKKALEIKTIPAIINDNLIITVQAESDKLIRNTVFTQARGLLRTEPQMLQPDIISIEKVQNTPKTINVIENTQNTIVKPSDFTENYSIEITEKVLEAVTEEVGTRIEPNDASKKDFQVEIVIRGNLISNVENEPVTKDLPNLGPEEPIIKKEEVKAEIKMETETPKTEVKEKKHVKKETKEHKEECKKITVTAISDFKGNEIQIAEGSVRKEHTDSYILTHVLDGYVIQESNMAFPIRKPLKEKIIYQNSELGADHKKEESYKHRTEDGKVIKDNSRILAISDLNLSEDDQIKEEETSEENTEVKSEEKSEERSEEKSEESCEVTDDPFSNLTAETVKSWSAAELTAHLSKYNWSETVTVLAEHELDGESLFLVSQPQLVQIGVSEAHADVICEFISK